ncbi:probable protein-S-isoprenylcysteine O-methyltransferase [Oryza brachyantha]|uniref:probable protein-S-isoprenylcysteine O-methyltransferase n=1 Tax=Oryza brachyantha TaxID=4533 RepID=UPI001ADB5C71|nr:probable protein-S-isoprenylcysteine O-methyltransferase [Oryza brachyantha]
MRNLPPAAAAAPREASPPPHAARALSPIVTGAVAQIPSVAMAARAQAWQFAAALVFFHGSEYVLAAAFHGRENVTATSLLISKQYVLAMSFAMLEHLTEALLFPELKEYWFVSHIGLLMVIIGEVIRKIAVVTAGRSFTHVIRIHYEDQHKLITHGVYRFMRHPGYSGFLLWAVGTQVMLCNPVSIVAFTLVLWRFFSKRIPYEEFFLRQFFGREYEEYAQKVHSGLPFIE